MANRCTIQVQIDGGLRVGAHLCKVIYRNEDPELRVKFWIGFWTSAETLT